MSQDFPPVPPPVVDPVNGTTADERQWAMLCHVSSLSGYLIPFGNIIGPLVVWLIHKDKMPFVDDQGKEALNFQISLIIYAIISGLLVLVLIGIFLLLALVPFHIICTIIAGLAASRGERYRYPFTIRLVK